MADEASAGKTVSQRPLLVLMPVYDDWPSAERLIVHLDETLAAAGIRAEALLVDDGSTVRCRPDCWSERSLSALSRIEVLRLRRNLGHQSAICVGLSYAEKNAACDAVVVMDSDGEDSPTDILRLWQKFQDGGGQKIVFAERTKRSEGWLFRAFYWLYCRLHRLLVGLPVRVGNFSIIPADRLRSLTVVSELWSHYAAAVFVSRLPYCSVPTRRAARLEGRSKMNFVGLVVHGLAAISAFSDRVGVRLMIVAAALLGLLICGMGLIVGVRLLTDWAVPGWATYAFGALLVMALQAIALSLLFCFVILRGRAGSSFLPARDCGYFIDDVQTVYPRT